MAFKDINCTCDEYCRCPDSAPCACESMAQDPHCMYCCQHLTPGQERVWKQDMIEIFGIDPDDWESQWDDDGGANNAENKNP